MSSETTTVKFMGKDVVVPKVVNYNRFKTIEENLSVAGVDPAEFEKMFEQWYAGLVASKMGIEVKQIGGAFDPAKFLTALGIISAGVAYGTFVYFGLAEGFADLKADKDASCAPQPTGNLFFGPREAVDRGLCGGARQALSRAQAEAIQAAGAAIGAACLVGVPLLMRSFGAPNEEANEVRINMAAAVAANNQMIDQLAENDAARAQQLANVVNYAAQRQANLNNAAIGHIADAVERALALGGPIAAAAPGGVFAAAAAAAAAAPRVAVDAARAAVARNADFQAREHEARLALIQPRVPRVPMARVPGYLEDAPAPAAPAPAAPAAGGGGGVPPSPEAIRLSLLLNGVSSDIANRVPERIKTGGKSSRSFKKSRRAGRARHTRRK
jgi:hypothetical protein